MDPTIYRCIFSALLAASITLAAQAQEPLRPGQQVEVNVRGEWMPGRVFRVSPDGKSVQVRVMVNRRSQLGTVPLDQVRLPGESDTPASPEPAATPAGKGPPIREWVDSTGKFRIQAALMGIKGDAAQLRKTDGTTISVPVARLSEADQQFLENLKAGARKRSAQNAMAAATSSGAEAPARAVQLIVPSVSCDMRGEVVEVDPQLPHPQGLADDASPTSSLPEGVTALPKTTTFEDITGIAVADPGAGLAVVAIANTPPKDPTTRLLWCDLKSGQLVKQAAFTGGHQVLAGGGQEGWLLTLGAKDQTQMIVWKWPNPQEPPQPQYSMKILTDNPSSFAKNIARAWVAGPSRAVIETDGDQVALWNLEQRKVEKVWSGQKAAVSAAGNRLAIFGNDGVGLFDLTSGNQTAYWNVGGVSVSNLELSPQATSIACLLQNEVRTLDLNSGEIRFAGALPQGAGSVTLGPPQWLGEDYLLIGRQHLVDLQGGLIAWQYTNRSGFRGVPFLKCVGSTACYISDAANPTALCSVSLPHAAARQAVAGVNPQELYALPVGGQVSLQASGVSAEARQALEKRIEENGWKITAGAPVQIVVSTKQGPQKSATYREGLGGSGAGTTVTFRPTLSEVEVKLAGETLWRESSETSLPSLIMAKKGQSTQDAVRQWEQPNVDFFAKLPFPRQIVHLKHQQGLGKTELSVSGIGR